MVDRLENRLTEVMITVPRGCEWDYKVGYKSSIEFCIRKHKEGWNLKQFKENLENVIKEYSYLKGDYLNGIVKGLEYNIKLMEN